MMTETQTIEIEKLVDWSEPKRVETKNGPRNLRTAPASQLFWAAWKTSKDDLKEMGVSCGKNRSDKWEAKWWMPLPADEIAALNGAEEASRATDANVDVPSPDGLEYLPYQRAGIAYAMGRTSTLIGDEMGLGKTIQAIGVFNADESISRVLIVCPASLRLNWRREWEKWTVRPVVVGIVNGGKKSDWTDADVTIINYDVLAKHRKAIDAVEWDLLIADEIHYCKNPKAARTKAVFGERVKNEVKSKPIAARRRLFLTGTPIVNRPVELFPVVEACDPDGLGKNFFAFAKKFCGAYRDQWGWKFDGASNLDELQRRLRIGFMVRRLKADVLTELPAKRRQVIEIPANGADEAVAAERASFENHRAWIEELEQRLEQAILDNYDAWDAEEIKRELTAARRTAFTEMAKERHRVAVAKIPHVVEHLRNALENGPVVCFAHHKDVVKAIAAEFNSVTLTGETSMDDRQAAVDAFERGDVDLFVGNIQAAGVGITLVRSSHVVFAELDWVPGNLSQAEDRCHRIGQQESVLVQHIVLEDSLDAEMVGKLIVKQENITAALDVPTSPLTPTNGTDVVSVATGEQPRMVAVSVPKPEELLTDEQIAAVHTALRTLSGMCDGAMELDGAGFNRFDTRTGKRLASEATLTQREAAIGRRIVLKYHRQLGDDLIVAVRG